MTLHMAFGCIWHCEEKSIMPEQRHTSRSPHPRNLRQLGSQFLMGGLQKNSMSPEIKPDKRHLLHHDE